jgi:chromosomal replication initiator protein
MEKEMLWKAVLSEAEMQISRPNFLTWLKNSKLVNQDEGAVVVALPNHFAREWVEAKYHKLILGIVRNYDDNIRKIEYVVESSLIKEGAKKKTSFKPSVGEKQLAFQEMRVDPETNLNPRYTLQSFIVGASNELAYSAASAVIENVGVKYNPLFIYGGVGLGKTHLMQAIGNEISTLYKGDAKVKYVTSEKFTNDVVWAIRNRRVDDIKNTYRHVDVLIIDDIQFIGGKEKTEEEFFHTFNALYEANKQIIISSDRPPRSIPTLEERLRSRFEAGMTADISFPDYETRVAIIKTKLQERNTFLEEEIVDLISRKIQKNVREIEGILNRIIFYQSNYQKSITSSTAEKIIHDIVGNNAVSATPSQIINAVASFFEISSDDLIGRVRSKEFIEPRQITMYLLRDMLQMSYPIIASKVGKRDHTTAIYACKKIANNISSDQSLNEKILLIKETVNKLG